MVTEATIREHVCFDADGKEWIPSVLAAALIPSSRPGKRTHLSTLYRLRTGGKLDGALRPDMGRGWWYRLDQIRALRRVQVKAVGSVPPAKGPSPRAADALARMNAGMGGKRGA